MRYGYVIFAAVLTTAITNAADKPNIVLIITDDQGYGDLGCHGNPRIQTPNLDKFAKESFQLRHFYVCPVCSPTRSSLMTGRWTYRTGIVDTSWGRSMMHPDETTIAEILSANGYRTGIFGKWHLGDNFPLRAMDQGFQEALVLKGGGIGQPSDLPGGTSYFDPVLMHNGKPEKKKGYVSDVITDAAIEFAKKDGPFFIYLPFNCPHAPLEVKDSDLKPYKEMNLELDQFPKTGFPIQKKYSVDTTAKIYAMVSNIDWNLGRLFNALEDKKIADNTIVIFMTDNGPQQPRYVSGFRGLKGTVYEGGVRVPFYARWPGKFPAGKGSDFVTAHIDVLPTLLAACGVAAPKGLRIDGISMLPALKGEKFEAIDRNIYLQWHRGDAPQLGRACMVRGPRYKIVQPQGVPEGKDFQPTAFELYDILNDPYEQTNLAAGHPEIVQKMADQYAAWFEDVKKERNFQHPRIHLGALQEPAAYLTRQDWRGSGGKWDGKSEGHWDVHIARAGKYRITLTTADSKTERTAHLKIGDVRKDAKTADRNDVTFDNLELKKGDARIDAWIMGGKERYGARYLYVERLGD
jgi:arylsulfatase/arylsulfatase A